jgi:sensor histidine kinase regulating citrate/malate metabolism
MRYFEKIEYAGDPVKAVMPDGSYIWTLAASDIPVTALNAFLFFGYYKFCNPGSRHGLPKIELELDVPQGTTFIGETVIIYNLLDEMRVNSKQANAAVFKIKISDSDERVLITISDDGEGINNQEVIKSLFIANVTTRPSNAGLALLFNGKPQLGKMGADINYTGVGVDGKGASFEMSFLKKMPT